MNGKSLIPNSVLRPRLKCRNNMYKTPKEYSFGEYTGTKLEAMEIPDIKALFEHTCKQKG